MIREAMIQALTQKPQRKLGSDLWVSDLGYHPAKAMRRIVQGATGSFGPDILEIMDQGNALEDSTLGLATSVLGSCIRQFPLYNDIWSGSADAVFYHQRSDLPPVIVEHKATSDKWWGYKGDYYKPYHVCQLWLYGQLYKDTYGVAPELILYYRAWKHYAELLLTEDEDGYAHLSGLVDGERKWFHTKFKPLQGGCKITSVNGLPPIMK
jgi:hypothetical protein